MDSAAFASINRRDDLNDPRIGIETDSFKR